MISHMNHNCSKAKHKNIRGSNRNLYNVTRNIVSLVGYLTMLLILRLYSINEKMINECEAVGGMRIERGRQSTWKKPPTTYPT